MTTRQRTPPDAQSDELPEEEEGLARAPAGAAPEADRERTRATPRLKPEGAPVWLLPASNEAGYWALPQGDSLLTAESLLLMCAPLKAPQRAKALAAAHAGVARWLRARFHDDLFRLIQKAVLCAGWVIGALVCLRLPAELRLIDALVLVGGVAYTGYVFVRYGLPVYALHRRCSALEHSGLPVSRANTPLIAHLDEALVLRACASQEERGQFPDAELLDTNAYRALIRKGVTTAAELNALGAAIRQAFGLNSPAGNARRLSEIAAQAGIDAGTAIFYRDLAHAAREIELVPQEML